MDVQPFKKTPEDDCVEAEIVSGPGAEADSGAGDGRRAKSRHESSRGYGSRREAVNIPFYGLFLRLKVIFIAVILLASFGFIVLGLILTSTLIGAIIGIPLLLVGGLLLWLLFKLLTFGQKNNTVVFRRF